MTIVTSQLTKEYHQGQGRITVLNNLDLHIKSAEKVAIWGQSGSGKTTLLSLLSGLERPTTGDITLLGQKMSGLSEKEWTRFRSRHIGIVFQQYHLIDHLTALENVLLPLEILGARNKKEKNQGEEAAYSLLTEVGLYSENGKNRRDRHFPSQLSGGECQRVALARALITRPGIILADEPSGSLDRDTGNKVMDLLFSLVAESKATLVLVTHNEELAQKCDRVLHLDGGNFREGPS